MQIGRSQMKISEEILVLCIGALGVWAERKSQTDFLGPIYTILIWGPSLHCYATEF